MKNLLVTSLALGALATGLFAQKRQRASQPVMRVALVGQEMPGFTQVCRPASASPAVGSHRQHVAEQRRLVDRALGVAQRGARAAPADASTESAGQKSSAAKSA